MITGLFSELFKYGINFKFIYLFIYWEREGMSK